MKTESLDRNTESSCPQAEAPARTALRALIGALEKTTEGSHQLDIEICRLSFPDAMPMLIQPYTTSLDAALTLVLEGWSVKLYTHTGTVEHHCDVYLVDREASARAEARLLQGPFDAECCATPALALCIAALKARLHD